MDILSSTEQTLYDYIKEKKQVSYNEIKKDLGEKILGAMGKLLREELIEKGKKRTGKANKYGYGEVFEKILKIKEEK